MSIIEDLKAEEGFGNKGNVYKCTEGFDTIGYGTKLPINEEEATLLLEYRLNKTRANLLSSLYNYDLPNEVWDILLNMSYQLGVGGVLKFKKMLEALKNKDYVEASKQGMDSLWAKQTPNRAKRLMDRLSKVK